MERTMSQEERIRRAEEIYNRKRREYFDKNRRYLGYEETEKMVKPIQARIMKKILTQIMICLVIYFSIYILVNSNYIFSQNIRNKIKKYLTYEINLQEIYHSASEFINSKENFFQKTLRNINKFQINQVIEENNEEQTIQKESTEENTNQLKNSEENIENNVRDETSQAVGGADDEDVVVDNRTQEEIDAEYIKQNHAIIWPVNGVITSRYGTRTPTDIVTAEHYGLDIGANTGTDIVAAMDGTVTLLSEYGDYGKHLQIENGDVATLYAHCSLLCVSEGETVSKGQKIAEVGQTR